MFAKSFAKVNSREPMCVAHGSLVSDSFKVAVFAIPGAVLTLESGL